jgi:hypothetical protein
MQGVWNVSLKAVVNDFASSRMTSLISSLVFPKLCSSISTSSFANYLTGRPGTELNDVLRGLAWRIFSRKAALYVGWSSLPCPH